ncbi:MAG: pentapeptide repeat-containing protein, partial [Frankiaceae bacterium]
VTVEHSHLDYVNLRGATVSQCQFLDCRIGELDLGGAQVRDVRFPRCEIDDLDVRGATLAAADLRGARLAGLDSVGGLAGAVVTEAQLVRLAPALAAHLGIRVLPPQ